MSLARNARTYAAYVASTSFLVSSFITPSPYIGTTRFTATPIAVPNGGAVVPRHGHLRLPQLAGAIKIARQVAAVDNSILARPELPIGLNSGMLSARCP